MTTERLVHDSAAATPEIVGEAHGSSAIVRLASIVLIVAGFALTLRVFWPGVMTFDAGYVYDSIKAARLGDWQSPVMVVVWSWLDPVAPGSGSMFLLIASLYWIGFGLIGWVIARRSAAAALAMPLLALMPPAFIFIGVIWRDMLLGSAWLLAAALAFATADRAKAIRVSAQAFATMLLLLGILLRPNAVLAAPLLAGYIAWPHQFAWKRAAVFLVPTALIFALLIPLVYYGLLDAKRQHPLHSLFVFDLGGITHFTGQNQFPVDWTREQRALVVGRCYQPAMWDAYWFLEPCRFVMDRLEQEKIFGAATLTQAWWHAVVTHPAAYLQHRATYFWTLLTGSNLTLPLDDLAAEQRATFMSDPFFRALLMLHDTLKPTFLFRVGFWLTGLLVVYGLAWPIRRMSAGAFALGVAVSALVYLLSYLVLGVAADFRYAYWAILALLVSAAVTLAGRGAAAKAANR